MAKPTSSHSTTLAPSSATMSMAARIVSTGEDGMELVTLMKIILFATPRKNWEVCLSESGDTVIFSLLSPHLEEVKSENAFDHLRHLLTLITNHNFHWCQLHLFSYPWHLIVQIYFHRQGYPGNLLATLR